MSGVEVESGSGWVVVEFGPRVRVYVRWPTRLWHLLDFGVALGLGRSGLGSGLFVESGVTVAGFHLGLEVERAYGEERATNARLRKELKEVRQDLLGRVVEALEAELER